MFKYLSLFLSVSLLAACGGGGSSSSNDDNSSSSSSVSLSSSSSSVVSSSSSSSANSESSSSSQSSASDSSSTTPSSSSSRSSSLSSSELLIQEGSQGFCRVDGDIESEHAGYTGNGYANTTNAANMAVSWQVSASSANTYSVTLRFANKGTAARSGTLVANGNDGSAAVFDLASTGGWDTWQEETQDIALDAGSNTLVITAQSTDGLSNIDSIRIQGEGLSLDDCAGASSSSSSSTNSSTSSSFSSVAVRAPKLEGWATENGGTTGGAGGNTVTATTGAEINQAMCSRASDTTPLIIYVDGTINHDNTTSASGSCDTTGEEIQFKGVSNISLIGVGDRGVLDQVGIHVRDASNIIVQNLHIKNVKKSGSPTSNGGDAIGMEAGVHNIWIDHNTLEASGGESDGYDSLVDMKNDVKYVTVSYNWLRNSSRGGLVGSSDTDDKNSFITFHHNWYENIEQRTPLLRHGEAHSFNNYWSNQSNGDMIHGINARMYSEVLVEGNYFYNSNNPLLASTDSSEPGCWTAYENTIDNIQYTRTVANGKAHAVPAIVDGQLQSSCATDVTVPYSYELEASANIPAVVTQNVGVGLLD